MLKKASTCTQNSLNWEPYGFDWDNGEVTVLSHEEALERIKEVFDIRDCNKDYKGKHERNN